MKKTDALIIGAGPTGLFTAHQLKLIGLDCEIVDNLDKKLYISHGKNYLQHSRQQNTHY